MTGGYEAAKLPTYDFDTHPLADLTNHPSIRTIQTHMRKALCGNTTNPYESAEWLEQLFALPIQQPTRRSNVTPIIYTQEYNDLLIDTYTHKIIGPHLALQTYNPTNTLFSRYNSLLEAKLWMQIDNSQRLSYKRITQIASLATSDTIEIKRKYIEPYMIQSYIQPIIITDNNNVPTCNPDTPLT
jgi:hypothetical protein